MPQRAPSAVDGSVDALQAVFGPATVDERTHPGVHLDLRRPLARALDRYAYSINGDRLVLLPAYSVAWVKGEGPSALIKRYGHTGPGIHVDGLEAWLYPIQPTDVAS